MSDAFTDYATTTLKAIGIDDEATIEYIAMLVADDDTGTEDKIETIEGILADTEPADVSKLVNELLAEHQRLAKAKQDAAEDQRLKALSEARAREKAMLAADIEERQANRGRELTKEERARRQKLIATYGESEIGEDSADTDTTLAQNDNAALIRQKEQAKREAAKALHAQTVERNKQALAKQRLDKEKDKEKKHTQKKEKRR